MQKLTREQAAIISIYTGVLCGPFEDMHNKAEDLVGHQVFSTQFGNKIFVEHLKSKVKSEFLALCADKD